MQYSETVWARGFSVLNEGSVIAGTQSNAGKGVMSGTSLGSGDCIVLSGSPTVWVEGKPVALHGSLVGMSNMNCQGNLLTKQAPPNVIVKDNALPCNNPPISSPVLEKLTELRQMADINSMESLRQFLDFSGGIQTADKWVEAQIDSLPYMQVGIDENAGITEHTVTEFVNTRLEEMHGQAQAGLDFVWDMLSGTASLGNMIGQYYLQDPLIQQLDGMILAEDIRLGNVCKESIGKQLGDFWDGIKSGLNKAWDDYQNDSVSEKSRKETRLVLEVVTIPFAALKAALLGRMGTASNVVRATKLTEAEKFVQVANDT